MSLRMFAGLVPQRAKRGVRDRAIRVVIGNDRDVWQCWHG